MPCFSRPTLGLCLLLLWSPTLWGAVSTPTANERILSRLPQWLVALEIEREGEVFPSLNLGIVHAGTIVWTGGLGVADRANATPARPDTLYRIASITKVFLATLTTLLAEAGKLDLEKPVLPLLPNPPPPFAGHPWGQHIRFKQLLNHSSGLPRLPVNFPPHDDNPYADFDRAAFLQGLADTAPLVPPGRFYGYSNFGYAVLGEALSRLGDEHYQQLLQRLVLDPLDLKDTRFAPSESQRARLAQGYSLRDGAREEVDWDMRALSAGGGLHSSVEDLARFLAVHLDAATGRPTPLDGDALRRTQAKSLDIEGWGAEAGLGWHRKELATAGLVLWHSGALGGFSSYLGFLPERDVGVVILTNRFKSVERYGEWLLRRLAEVVR